MKKYFKNIILITLSVLVIVPPKPLIYIASAQIAPNVTLPANGSAVSGATNGSASNGPTGTTGKDTGDKVSGNSFDCSYWNGTFIACSVANITAWVLSIAAEILYHAGQFFDWLLNYSLNMVQILKDYKLVSVGWKVLLDITNIAYIFILLFVALSMIVGNSSYGNKQMIAQVIITAVLVNFSLFATKVFIDATNIAAIQFYNSMTSVSSSSTSSNTAKSITAGFMNVLGLQTIYSNATADEKSGTTNSNQIFAGLVNEGKAYVTDSTSSSFFWKIATLAILGSILIIITAVVFFAGGFLFLSRTITLLFLMLFSSLAVASRALPATKPQFDGWWKKLMGNAMFAPVFLGLLYILVYAFSTKDANSVNFASMILGGNFISGLVQFFMVIALLLGIMFVSTKFSVMGADFAYNAMNKRIGKDAWLNRTRAVGTGGVNLAKGVGVRTLGLGATKLAESRVMRNVARFIPGGTKAMSGMAKATGVEDLRKNQAESQKKKDAYVSGYAPQGARESNEKFEKRQLDATNRGLKRLGLNEKGEELGGIRGLITSVKKSRIFGGAAFANLQRAKAKEVVAASKSKARAMAQSVDLARGIETVLGGTGSTVVETIAGQPATATSPAVPTTYKDKEDALYELQAAINRKEYSLVPGTNQLRVGNVLVPAAQDLAKSYKAWKNPSVGATAKDIADAKKDFEQMENQLIAKLNAYSQSKDRALDKAEREAKDAANKAAAAAKP